MTKVLSTIEFMKTINLIFLTSILLAIVGCKKPTTGEGGDKTYTSEAYKVVEKNIYKMAEGPWNKNTEQEIRGKQIPSLPKSSEKGSATTLLDVEYKKQLVREARKILDEGCPNAEKSHKAYDQMMAELKTYTKNDSIQAPGLKEVLSLKKLHDEAANFTRTAIGRQSVNSYRTTYDKSHETKQISKATSYLENSKIKCKTIRKKLENLTKSSAYNYRKNAYCEDIVKHYLECSNPAKSELNAVKANLKIYVGDVQPLKDQLDAHYEELNKDNEKN